MIVVVWLKLLPNALSAWLNECLSQVIAAICDVVWVMGTGRWCSLRSGMSSVVQPHHLLSTWPNEVCLLMKACIRGVLQGVLGTMATGALRFVILWLQLRGLSDAAAGTVYAAYLIGSALGSCAGGFLGDAAAAAAPLRGRIAVAQLSTVLGMPCAALFLKVKQQASLKALLGFRVMCRAFSGGCAIAELYAARQNFKG